MGRVAVIDYGIGNLGSATNAFRHLGIEAYTATTPSELGDPELVVVPGVGSFGACVEAFRSRGFAGPVLKRIEAGNAVLGICVGMQMLFEGSEESPGVSGLGVLAGKVARMSHRRLPEMQWNQLELAKHPSLDQLPRHPWMYFVHSYSVVESESAIAWEEFSGRYVAAVADGNLIGVQFHPEKSSAGGLALLRRVAELAGAVD